MLPETAHPDPSPTDVAPRSTTLGCPRVLVVGGGYVGMVTAYRLGRLLRAGEAEVVVVDPRSFMTYQPFLPEAAAGSLDARSIVVPLRRGLPRARVVTARVTRVEHERRVATIAPHVGDSYEMTYDELVVAVGAVSRTLPIPGLAEFGIGFKTVEEAIALHNRVIDKLDEASSLASVQDCPRLLTFIVVGAGFAGVEALAELEDMAHDLVAFYPELAVSDLRWVLVEASDRVLPELSTLMSRYALAELQARGVDVRLDTRLVSCVDGHVVLSDGTELEADTVVWTAGVRPHPMLTQTDLPLGEKGHVRCEETLAVAGVANAWAAGDCAAVPDLSRGTGDWCPPTAQYAVRQAKVLAANVVASLRGEPLTTFHHANLGTVASLGLYRGVAQILGVHLHGFPAWFAHRTYHLYAVPTWSRKAHTVADWTLALVFRRELTSLGTLHDPRAGFAEAAGVGPSAEASRASVSGSAGVRPRPVIGDGPGRPRRRGRSRPRAAGGGSGTPV
ncbi:MAG: NAD(P)/FAD-dependent oxidoreductase [Actinomycetes bacterium]